MYTTISNFSCHIYRILTMRTIIISIMPNPFSMWEKHYNEFDSKMIADEFNVA